MSHVPLQLFVKNIPGNMTKDAALSVFSSHGKVHSLQRDRDRAQVCYVVSVGDGLG